MKWITKLTRHFYLRGRGKSLVEASELTIGYKIFLHEIYLLLAKCNIVVSFCKYNLCLIPTHNVSSKECLKLKQEILICICYDPLLTGHFKLMHLRNLLKSPDITDPISSTPSSCFICIVIGNLNCFKYSSGKK